MDDSTKQTIGIRDLLEEILGIIFDCLTVSELKVASLVCLQWSHLVFSGRRLDRVLFYVDNNYVKRAAINVLRKTKRRYRHIRFIASDRGTWEKFVPILQRFERFLVSLKLGCCNEVSLIKRILLKVPNLKALSLNQLEDIEECHGFIQLPELKQLTVRELRCNSTTPLTVIDFRTMAPNLQEIVMKCDTDSSLNVYRRFSDQLISVVVFLKNDEYMHSFCEIVFPKLLEIKVFILDFFYDCMLNANCGFITGSKHLQRATLGFHISQTIINSLVENCCEITFLSIHTDKLKNRSLLGLANLKHLNTLVLKGTIPHDLFDDCKPIPSLQALHVNSMYVTYLHGIKDRLMFFKGLCTAAPYLTELYLDEFVDDRCLQFICNNILSLKCLKLSYKQSSWTLRLEYLNRLPHLFKLSLNNMYPDLLHVNGLIKIMPLYKITVLSIHGCNEWAVLLIPQVFPSLQMLKMNGYEFRSDACIKKLRSLLPNCTIIRNC